MKRLLSFPIAARRLAAAAVLSTTVLAPAAAEPPGPGDMWNPHWMQRQIWGPRDLEPAVKARMSRHWTFMHQGIPEEYLRASNPLPQTEATVREGRALYMQHCASCHGPTGNGDGEAGKSLSPSPALLAYLIQMPMTVDSYLLWSVSEGGVAFGTAMPSFKATLAKDEIWKIVAFMRAGFPESAATK